MVETVHAVFLSMRCLAAITSLLLFQISDCPQCPIRYHFPVAVSDFWLSPVAIDYLVAVSNFWLSPMAITSLLLFQISGCPQWL